MYPSRKPVSTVVSSLQFFLIKIQAAFAVFEEECEPVCVCIRVRKLKNDNTFAHFENDKAKGDKNRQVK